jgi:hypothetical protein
MNSSDCTMCGTSCGQTVQGWKCVAKKISAKVLAQYSGTIRVRRRARKSDGV